MSDKETVGNAGGTSNSELNDALGVGGDRAEYGDRSAYFTLGCDMLLAAHSDLETHIEKLEAELKTQRELERQYSQQLGRLAQLCDTIIPWVQGGIMDISSDDVPIVVRDSIAEIMDYVDAVRP